MIAFNFNNIFISGIDLIHVFSMLRLHKIVSLSHDKKTWDKTGRDMIDWIQLFYVHTCPADYAFSQKLLYYHCDY